MKCSHRLNAIDTVNKPQQQQPQYTKIRDIYECKQEVNMSVLLLFLWYFYEGFYVHNGYSRALCLALSLYGLWLWQNEYMLLGLFRYACKGRTYVWFASLSLFLLISFYSVVRVHRNQRPSKQSTNCLDEECDSLSVLSLCVINISLATKWRIFNMLL